MILIAGYEGMVKDARFHSAGNHSITAEATRYILFKISPLDTDPSIRLPVNGCNENHVKFCL
jgi:hypothetical protein